MWRELNCEGLVDNFMDEMKMITHPHIHTHTFLVNSLCLDQARERNYAG